MRFAEFARAAQHTTPAVVLGVSSSVGLGTIWNLAEARVPVLALHMSSPTPGLLSRYPAKGLFPNPHYEEEAFIQTLLDIGRRLPQRAVLFPCQDDCIHATATHADTLEAYYILPFSADRLLSVELKEEQMRAAWRAGVGTPVTEFISCDDDIDRVKGLVPFPAVLKSSEHLALRRRDLGKVIHVQRREELAAVCGRLGDCGTLMLQEFVPGGDDQLFTLQCYVDRQSRPLAVFCRRKIRQHPRRFGICRLGESVWVDDVAEDSLRLLREIGFHGMAGIEFKRDPRDGRLKLMEINARHVSWHRLATAEGVNFSQVAYMDSIGRPFTAPAQKGGTRYIWASRDIPDSVLEILRGQLSPIEWASSLRGVRVDAMLSLRDPVPGLFEAADFLGRATQRRLPSFRRRTARAGGADVAPAPD